MACSGAALAFIDKCDNLHLVPFYVFYQIAYKAMSSETK
jgi:hypothetical protein